jgi:CHAT domain-containing protein
MVVVPHSVLAYLPFAALRREATGRYLMEDYVLLQSPSAAALAVLRSAVRREAAGSQLGGMPAAFAPFPRTLPGSAREARAFRRVVPDAVTHEGASATEARLREALSGGGIVHVATHGVMNLRNPMFSRVELARNAGRPEDDGRLEVHELLELRISAPLVFLSGCETGVGAAWSTQFARGEDYATLAQAFLYAGARSVMATLWRIGDEGAAAFAERFYARLSAVGPAEALAVAQRELLQSSRYAAPYYWAAYQVSGDGGLVYPHRAAGLSVQQHE